MRIVPDIPLTLKDISTALNSKEKYGDIFINAFTTDSRLAVKGDVFIAVEGECESGEKYVKEAKNKGAYVISAKYEGADFPVKSTKDAILDLIKYYRSKFALRELIAISGSVGKTTAKNILCDMLKTKHRVHKTYENFNNYLGVFHTVMSMPRDTEIAIFELGMNHTGEISELSLALSPTLSVITNVGVAHIGNLGSRENIAKAKLEILDGMKKKRYIAPFEEELLASSETRITVSREDKGADCYIRSVDHSKAGTNVSIKTKRFDIPSVNIPLPGEHILFPVGCGALIFDHLGHNKKELVWAIERIKESSVRAGFKRIGALTFYDDTYNSSPEALYAVFKLLRENSDKKISCVLGDMLELGEKSEDLHKEVGHRVAKLGFDKLFTFGPLAESIALGATDSGMDKNSIFKNPDLTRPEKTAKQIRLLCRDDEIILCKASHAVEMGRILDWLEENK